MKYNGWSNGSNYAKTNVYQVTEEKPSKTESTVCPV